MRIGRGFLWPVAPAAGRMTPECTEIQQGETPMRAKHLILAGCAAALAAAAPLLSAGDAPKADKPNDLDALAAKLVTQSARVREGELVQVAGSPKDAEVMEDLAVQVRKQGAFPLLTLTSDRLARRLYDDVPEKY